MQRRWTRLILQLLVSVCLIVLLVWLAPGFFLLHLAGLLAAVALMNPRASLACFTWVGRRIPGLQRLAAGPRGERVRQGFCRLLDEPPLPWQGVLRLVLLGLASFS